MPDLDSIVKRLKSYGVHFEFENGSDGDTRFVIILDNNRNPIQLFERKKPRRDVSFLAMTSVIFVDCGLMANLLGLRSVKNS